jgi:hypothetical protein
MIVLGLLTLPKLSLIRLLVGRVVVPANDWIIRTFSQLRVMHRVTENIAVCYSALTEIMSLICPFDYVVAVVFGLYLARMINISSDYSFVQVLRVVFPAIDDVVLVVCGIFVLFFAVIMGE